MKIELVQGDQGWEFSGEINGCEVNAYYEVSDEPADVFSDYLGYFTDSIQGKNLYYDRQREELIDARSDENIEFEGLTKDELDKRAEELEKMGYIVEDVDFDEDRDDGSVYGEIEIGGRIVAEIPGRYSRGGFEYIIPEIAVQYDETISADVAADIEKEAEEKIRRLVALAAGEWAYLDAVALVYDDEGEEIGRAALGGIEGDADDEYLAGTLKEVIEEALREAGCL